MLRERACAPSWRVLILWLLSGCSAPAILSASREAKCYAQLSEARRASADNMRQRVDRLIAVAHAYPNCPHAATAIQQAVHLVMEGGEAVQVGRLHRALTDLTNRSENVAVDALWWRARLESAGLRNPWLARRTLRALIERAPGHARTDEALWMLADIYRGVGAWEHALRAYEVLIQQRFDRGWFVGSERSPYAARAALLIADINAFVFQRIETARDGYRQFRADFSDSPLYLDATFGLVHCLRLLKQEKAARDMLLASQHMIVSSRHQRIFDHMH